MKTCFLSIDVEPFTALSHAEQIEEDLKFEPVKKLGGILDIFKKHSAQATLFVTGEALEHYPDLVKSWAENFEIGCHNYYHIELDKVDLLGREKQIKDFIKIYNDVLGKNPEGFRAPRNVIDNQQLEILERYGFIYDSSVLPRYPLGLKRYAGYRGRAPIKPYFPDKENYRKTGENTLIEIPEAPGFMAVPLVGTWLRKFGVKFFKFLFLFKNPDFISLSMHSWDGVEFEGKGSQNSGKRFLKQLDELMKFLKNIGYEFKPGIEIYKEFLIES